jgi:hypothetical protein
VGVRGLIRSERSNLYLFFSRLSWCAPMNLEDLVILFSSFVLVSILIKLTDFAEKNHEVGQEDE